MEYDNLFEPHVHSLLSQTMHYVVQNINVLGRYDEEHCVYDLHDDVCLPCEICDALLSSFVKHNIPMTDAIINLFADTERTRLKQVKLSGDKLTIDSLKLVLKHNITELDISACKFPLNGGILSYISQHSQNLKLLFLGANGDFFAAAEDMTPEFMVLHNDKVTFCSTADTALTDDVKVFELKEKRGSSVRSPQTVLQAPNLLAFSVHKALSHFQVYKALEAFSKLTYLDLSNCDIEFQLITCLAKLQSLNTCILYNVRISKIECIVGELKKLKNLRVLDLSTWLSSNPAEYSNANEVMNTLIDSLTQLEYLDISGTNLAGGTNDPLREGPIAGLGVGKRHLKFLGLLGCAGGACRRKCIPATQITGSGNEEQILTGLRVYRDRPEMILYVLNDLFTLLQEGNCKDEKTALIGILSAMNKHFYSKHIQISGSASLFYLVKMEPKHLLPITRRAIIDVLLTAMEKHINDTVMTKNGCLTLCYFVIPRDVLYCYERVVFVLLSLIRVDRHTAAINHLRRISMYLLNNMVCQVSGEHKTLVGQLDAIQAVLEVIKYQIQEEVYDDILEIAWSTLWNVTDETPENCQEFIDHGGLECFRKSLEIFSDRKEIVRNMMGLMGNVSEVDFLRPSLMTTTLVKVFCEMLNNDQDGLEISYNACGVLAHMMSDGEHSWTIDEPSRDRVMYQMTSSVNSWPLRTKRNINYRSFKPIFPLLDHYTDPPVVYWAVWALCNLSKMYPQKYCPLILKEDGLPYLHRVVAEPSLPSACHQLAERILALIGRYEADPDSITRDTTNSDEEGDGDEGAAAEDADNDI